MGRLRGFLSFARYWYPYYYKLKRRSTGILRYGIRYGAGIGYRCAALVIHNKTHPQRSLLWRSGMQRRPARSWRMRRRDSRSWGGGRRGRGPYGDQTRPPAGQSWRLRWTRPPSEWWWSSHSHLCSHRSSPTARQTKNIQASTLTQNVTGPIGPVNLRFTGRANFLLFLQIFIDITIKNIHWQHLFLSILSSFISKNRGHSL